MINNVLVAIDGSENSDKALNFALELTEKFCASLIVLNVSEPPAMGAVPLEPTNLPGDNMAIFANDLLKFHEEIINKAVTHAKKVKPNIAIMWKQREGEPAAEIVAEAKATGSDVVVVGHRDSSRVRELFLGNVSEKVAHLAPCPVIIVK